VMQMADQVNRPMDGKLASQRMMTQCVYNTINPQQIIIDLLSGGVPERYPDLHFSLIEFNAHWLASLVGALEKAWMTGVGQDADVPSAERAAILGGTMGRLLGFEAPVASSRT